MVERLTVKFLLRQYAVVLLAPLLLFGPMLLRGQVIFWGTPALQFIPWWVAAWDSLCQGVLPLWNPLNGMGAPLIANYQLAFFYPPNWLLLIFAALGGPVNAAAFVAWGYTILAVLHLAWAGLGMSLLLRRMGFPWLGQIIGGLAFGLSGYIVARLGFLSMAWVAAWLPWVIYFADQIAAPGKTPASDEKMRFRLLPGLIGALAMQLLGGHAQLTWYTLLLAFAWITIGAARTAPRAQRVLLAWLSLGAAALLAAGLAAIQLVPTFEFLRLSHRAGAVAYPDAMVYSFWPWRILTIFSPDFFGSPVNGDFWGYASYWEDHLYIGMVPLLLAASTLWIVVRGLHPAKRDRRWVLLLFLWLGMAIAFLLALGKNTPVFPFLYKYIPTFSMFQAPARYLLWVAFALPILAAVGIEHWRCPTGRGLYWFRLSTAGAFAVTLGAGLAWIFMQNIRLTFVRATALTGLWALGFGLLTLLIPFAEKHARRDLWHGAVISWTLFDLLFTGWGLNPGITPAFYTSKSQTAENIISGAQGQRVYMSRREESDLKFKRFMRFKDFAPIENWGALRSALIPNLNLLDSIAMTSNFDPLVTERYARWMTAVETLNPETQPAWLALMGAGLIERIDQDSASGIRFDPISGAQRWRWFDCAEAVQNSEASWQIMESRFKQQIDPANASLVLEGVKAAETHLCNGKSTGAEATILLKMALPDRLVLDVNAPTSGWLMIADTWYPGWQAQVDTASTAIYPADFLFRAVSIPVGHHQVILQYRPFGFYFGAMLSILVLLFVTFQLNRWGRNSA